MADYYPLVARAIAGLTNNTGEVRRALYDRARSALVNQLRNSDPPLSEEDITHERLALEEAIRKVEAAAAHRPQDLLASLVAELEAPGHATPSAAPPPPPAAPSAEPSEPPPSREPEGSNSGYGAEAAPHADTDLPSAPVTPEDAASSQPPVPQDDDPARTTDDLQGTLREASALGRASARSAQAARNTRDAMPGQGSVHGRMPKDGTSGDPVIGAGAPPPFDEPEQVYRGSLRSYSGLITVAVILLGLAVLGSVMYWQRNAIMSLFTPSKPSQTQSASRNAANNGEKPKIADRIAPGGSDQRPNTAPASDVAQKVVLYEEDPNDPQGKRSVGSVLWRTETVSPGPGLAPELVIRGDIDIPERRMKLSMSLRRNADKALPASHTMEILFTVPADFSEGGIANVPGVLVKIGEQTRGTPLSGLAVKVTNGYFLIGLSSVDSDMQRNLQMLKERPWFDIPVVYNNGKRAIIAVEKGPGGERVFEDALRAWGQFNP